MQLVQEGLFVFDHIEAQSSGLGLVASTSIRNWDWNSLSLRRCNDLHSMRRCT